MVVLWRLQEEYDKRIMAVELVEPGGRGVEWNEYQYFLASS
jgi:hypothetical protein